MTISRVRLGRFRNRAAVNGPYVTVLAVAALTIVLHARQPLFEAGVDVVRVDVSVTDHGDPVRGLTADNFVVTDNGTPEPVTSVALEQLPLRVVLVLDTSGSLEGPGLATLIDASRGLVGALKPPDRIAVLTFTGAVKLLSGFDAARPALLSALGGVQAGGTTSLFDALQVAFALVRMDDAAPSARPLIIACTDGLDTSSWLSGDTILEAARRADVVVQTIEPPVGPTLGLVKPVETLAKVSGGRTWTAKSEKDLKGLFTQTLTDMRDRYLLAFTPRTPVREGWHDLEITLKNARGDVLARPGYYVDNRQHGRR